MSASQLVDVYGRVHDYLRISVTDQCNLRCLYCMPEEGMEFMESDKLLSFDEIERFVRVGAELGIRKLRLTGGEPLLRRDIELLIARLSVIPGIEDISLTTNGIFLERKAEALKHAGLNRVNISLDTMDPTRFRLIARSGGLDKVLNGIRAAAAVGLQPIKLNCVLLKGVNEDEIGAFLRLCEEQPLHVRFIEYMPIGHADQTWRNHYLPLSRVLEVASELGMAAERTEQIRGNGPSDDYRIAGGAGSFGLIHPVSDQFCERCNRLRLTADGSLKPCLYWVDELNVRECGEDEGALRQLYSRALAIKPQNHEMAEKLWEQEQSHIPTDRRMSQIGG